MNFSLTDEQREIKDIARSVLTARCTPERVRENAEARRYDEALWPELAELGWPGIVVDERYGGQALGVVEAMCLCEELGYAVAATPFLSTTAAALMLRDAGTERQQAHWLPQLASGDAIGAVGLVHGGEPALVPDGQCADVVLLVDGATARLVDPSNADVQPVETIDPTRRYARVAGDGPALPGDTALAFERASILAAAELVGICQRALDGTVAYVKDRKQFDRPVGSYQAIAHRCADMLVDTEGARSAVYGAAWAADADADRLPEASALASAVSGEAARNVTASAVQAHGGIGFTWEADVHWGLKRAQLGAILFGSPGTHRQRLALVVAARRAHATGS